jgi:hypothetical protein
MRLRIPTSPRYARAAALAAVLTAFAAASPAAAAPDPNTAPGEVEYSVAGPTPPRAARAGRCSAAIEVSSQRVLAGESVTVSGTVECPEGTEAGGQTVTLLAHTPRGEPGFAPVATATSEADGSYRIQSPALEENTSLFVRLERGHSAHKRVRVAPLLTVIAPASGASLSPGDRADGEAPTNTVTFTGTVAGARPALVVLQGELPVGGGHWRRIAVTHVDESGRYSITHTFKRPGVMTVRLLVRSGGAGALAASAPLTYTIASRPRPAHQAPTHAPRARRGEPTS